MVLLKVICLVSGTLADHKFIPSFFEPSHVPNINISEAPSINDQDVSRSNYFNNSKVESILSSLDFNNDATSKSSMGASTSLTQSSLGASTSFPKTTEASNKTTVDCPCANESETLPPSVLEMKEQIKNKTSLLSKIRHRATHSRDALWASIVMTGMIVMLVIAVLHSKMWQDTTFVSNQDSQPVKYEQYNSQSEIPVKEMLRGRARSLLELFKKNSQKSRNGNALSMETFMTASEDTVDSSHQFLLESSSEDDMWNDSGSDSEEDIVFKMNKRTGDWEGAGEVGESLLAGGAVRYVRRKEFGRKDEVSNSILREISRVSSCSESSELEFMRIG